ncbi:hypothetical protein SAMN05216227_102041 [Pseudorhodobacter antarcticus]|uniref:Internal virion protein n=1 Tax=Pseudorhodobacter antarcticus TaxID=1077947 RepID=A0A1H8IJC2_9RHOB|nr:hypothetical protein [Pseudorhodobacter antarcticus]SEN67798.1 hypothetical protein SAMN05216227_102041 [Pseudorhodobacter antarcticus]
MDNEQDKLFPPMQDTQFSRAAAEKRKQGMQDGAVGDIVNGFKETAAYAAHTIIKDEAVPLAMDMSGVENPADIPVVAAIAGMGLSLLGFRGGEKDYDKDEKFDELTKGIPYEFQDEILENDNFSAALRSRERIKTDLKRAERVGNQNSALGVIVGGLVDVDLPMTVMSGGAFASAKVARTALKASKAIGLSPRAAGRLAGTAMGINAGAQAGALVGAANSYMRETQGWEEAVNMAFGAAALGGMMGTAFSGAGGITKKVATEEVMARTRPDFRAAQEEFHSNIRTDHPAHKQDLDVESMIDTADNIAPEMMDSTKQSAEDYAIAYAQTATPDGSTVGAASIKPPVQPTGLVDPLMSITPTSDAIHKATRDWRDQSGWGAQKQAEDTEWFARVATSKLGSFTTQNFTELYQSKAATANYLAGTIFESASGLGRGRATAAILMENYTKRVQSHLAREVESATTSFAREAGETWKGTGYGASNKAKVAFNREVMLEMNDRLHGRQSKGRSIHVLRAADQYDKAGAEGVTIGKGREGQTAMDGFEDIEVRSGYTPYAHNGAAIHAAEVSGRTTRKDIIAAYTSAYRAAGMSNRKDAGAVAKAVIQRALAREGDVDVSLVSLLSGDGKQWLEESLEKSGMPAPERQALMDRLIGKQGEKSKEGFAKRRNDIDLNTPIRTTDGSELKIVDLLDNDMHKTWQRYSRRLAGSAALSRFGITNRAQRKDFITALQAEQRALGEVPIEAGKLEAMFSHFNGGPIAGYFGGAKNEGVGDLLATVKRLTNIALLEKLGITQLAETGVQMAQNGISNWVVRGPMAIFDKELRAGNRRLLDDMAYFTGQIGDDHRHFAQWLDLDDVTDRDSATWLKGVSKLTSNAQWVQGYTSLFNSVRSHQQTTAALGVADKVMRTIKESVDKGEPIPEATLFRMQMDLGFGYKDDINTVIMLIQDGTIEFNTTAKGNVFVNKLNMDKWDVATAENFGASITRNVNQLVQKSMAGEQDAWMHTQWGSVVTHLKTFPLQAVQKQVLRNARHMDMQNITNVMYGMATAAVAVMVRDTLDGRERSTTDLAKSAFNYSNMTGFIPMVLDPVLTMVGLEDMRFNRYGPYTDLTPPMIKVLNDQRRIPGAIIDTVMGNADWYDKQALKSLPFAGTIGISRAFD